MHHCYTTLIHFLKCINCCCCNNTFWIIIIVSIYVEKGCLLPLLFNTGLYVLNDEKYYYPKWWFPCYTPLHVSIKLIASQARQSAYGLLEEEQFFMKDLNGTYVPQNIKIIFCSYARTRYWSRFSRINSSHRHKTKKIVEKMKMSLWN